MKWMREFREKMSSDPKAKKRIWYLVGGVFIVVLIMSLLLGK